MTRRRLLILAAILGGLVLILALAVPLLVPTGSVRQEIETRVSRATGRDFRIHGSLAFTLYPDLGLTARDVSLANAPGGRAHDLAHIESMHIAVRLLPLLLHGRIEANEIVLGHPRIALEIDKAGAANWKLAPDDGSDSRLAMGAAATAQFSGVTVEDGELTYDNAKLDIHRALDGLDARIAVSRLDARASARGAFVFAGRKLDFTATADTPASLLAGQTTGAIVSLRADFLTADFTGHVTSDGTLVGAVSLKTASLKDLAGWLGHPVSAGQGLGAFEAQGDLVARGHGVSIDTLHATLDGMRIAGKLSAEIGGAVPRVEAAVSVDHLDLNTYVQLGGGGATGVGGGRPAGPPSGGWSKAPIKLDLVKLIDGHLTLQVGRLSVLHLKTGKAAMAVTLDRGKMTAVLDPLQLYGGSGGATLVVDASGPVPRFANLLTFTGIDMHGFLADTIGVDKMEGRGTLSLDVGATGASPDAVMRSLSGKGSVNIGHGAVHGVDMGRVARTVETLLSAGATGRSAATEFDRFGGTFTITNGLLENRDLQLASVFITMTGAGRLDLGNQTIAYRIVPKASLGGKLHLLDIGVPFAITGTWAHLRYQADIAGVVTGLVGSVIDKGTGVAGGLLDTLTGGPAKPAPKKKSKSLGDRLKGVFGFH